MTPNLLKLRDSFLKRGFDIRFCGGYVRDTLLGKTPTDIDFCTDATPDEQAAIYTEDGIQHIPTGLQHGTWTVVIGKETFEITTLRTETDHDGRHATVSWTRDWMEDLSRRDLTINAMAMSFEGVILDPFNGQKDLENKRVRFVGKAAERIKEDYLRVLRFFRFHARFGARPGAAGGDPHYDREAIEAVQIYAVGLQDISRERVWSEMSRIVSGPIGYFMVRDLISFDVAQHIDLPIRNVFPLMMAHGNTKDPASLMAAYLGDKADVEDLAKNWKWSKDERKQAIYIASQPTLTLKEAKLRVAVNKDEKYWVAETLRVQSDIDSAAELLEWSVPKFPVNGDDLLTRGYADTIVGVTLHDLKTLWGVSNYKMTKEELLSTLA